MFAYCWASGEIAFGEKVPKGALDIAQGEGAEFKAIIEVCARHAYDGEILLVPGLPEATNEKERLDALLNFRQMVNDRLSKTDH